MVTNIEASANADNLHDSLEVALKYLGKAGPGRPDLRAKLDELRVQHADARLPQSGFDNEPEHNLIRQSVDQPLKISGADARTVRQQENAAAIGGMKGPRTSLHKVPGHRQVG